MTDRRFTIHAGDCRDVLRGYPDATFDSVVSDPPYGLTFMGKGWDRGVPGEEFWREALRVAKPGAHLLAFGGTRTFHRLAVAIEDAGWEVRDCVMWVYGSGFPKSLNLDGDWHGWGTALKPAWEPVIVARKPLDGTVAANVLRHGTGALNIDGCRVSWQSDADKAAGRPASFSKAHEGFEGKAFNIADRSHRDPVAEQSAVGRWPANLLHDGSDEVLAGFPEGSFNPAGVFATGQNAGAMGGRGFGSDGNAQRDVFGYGDSGSAARFFYCAKASRTDREEGCDHLPARSGADAVERDEGTAGLQSPRAGAGRTADTVRNFHPTVKPTDLMRYLCRLVTQPNGLVLDPFCGSGSTGKGALLEGFRFVGIDLDPAHVAIAEARCQFAVDTVEEQAAAAEAPGAQLSLF